MILQTIRTVQLNIFFIGDQLPDDVLSLYSFDLIYATFLLLHGVPLLQFLLRHQQFWNKIIIHCMLLVRYFHLAFIKFHLDCRFSLGFLFSFRFRCLLTWNLFMVCRCICFSFDRDHLRLRHGTRLEKTVIMLVVVISKAVRVVFRPEIAIRWLFYTWQNCNVFLFIPALTLLFLWLRCGFRCGEKVRAFLCVIHQKCMRAAFISCLFQLVR